MKTLAGVLMMALLVTRAAARGEAAFPQVQPVAFEHGTRAQKKVALTFDACTTTRERNPYDPRITAELEALHVPATIFVGGGWAQKEKPALRELTRSPLIEIGNHTFTHPHLTRLTDAQIRDELVRTQVEVASLTGRTPSLFRPPYGEYDGRVLRVAAEMGLTTVEYDLASGDPDPHVTKQALVNWVLREARPGSIIVMHINHQRFATAEALPEIIAGLRLRGFELVTVGELLRAAPAAGAVIAHAHHGGLPHA